MLRKVQRQKAKIKIGISGVSGAGKTYSALLLASGLADWSKVCIIDTENGSADLYDNLGGYNVYPLDAPYTPERYIDAIQECEKAGMEVIIIDSVTHEWNGKGGILETNEIIAQTRFKGNSWAAWSVSTPKHQKFIEAMLTSNCHIIACSRSKTDTISEGGKVKKIGLKEEQREGFDYEFSLFFTIDRETHYATASKDRTGIFENIDPFVITPETGKKLIDWTNEGVEPIKQTKQEQSIEYVKASIKPMTMPDDNWSTKTTQAEFQAVYVECAKKMKWNEARIKENYEAILKGKTLDEITETQLQAYIQQFETKLK